MATKIKQTEEFTPAPECKGCDECGVVESRRGEAFIHYSDQHGGRWLCRDCFFKLPPGLKWPKPRVQEEEEMEAKRMLEIAEKVLKYCENNSDDPEKIKKAIERYRKERNKDRLQAVGMDRTIKGQQ